MKKMYKVFACLLTTFLFTGCFSGIYAREASNNLTECQECTSVDDIGDLIDNVEAMMNKVDAISGTYELTNTKTTYKIDFDVITKDKRINWDLYAKTIYNEKELMVYFKDSKFYLIYPNNGANVILKDSIKNLVIEAEDALDKLNASYNKDNLENLLTGDKLEGFNFEGMKSSGTYVMNDDGTYTITYEENSLIWEYDISSNYLITETRCNAINFDSMLIFEYPSKIEITYPMGLDFLTLDIKEVKEILEIESFAEILDESLKDSNSNQQ